MRFIWLACWTATEFALNVPACIYIGLNTAFASLYCDDYEIDVSNIVCARKEVYWSWTNVQLYNIYCFL